MIDLTEFDETFVIKQITNNGKDVISIKKTFNEESPNIYDMAELFRQFLKSLGYSDTVIDSILVDEE